MPVLPFQTIQQQLKALSQIEPWLKPHGSRAVVLVMLIAAMIAGAGVVVYESGGTYGVWVHLMYFPIILAAASFRIYGGVIASIVAGLAVGPFMPLNVQAGIMQPAQVWLPRVGFYLLVGLLVAFLFIWLEQQYSQLKESYDLLEEAHEELKAAQLLLIQKAKLETVGRLAAGVAHEVKNPLAIIQMGVDFLEMELGDKPAGQETLASMADAVARADMVIRGLLDFSRSEELHRQPTHFNQLVEKSLLLVRHECTKGQITVEPFPGQELPVLDLDANKIEQVIINMLMNSIQAMTPGGTITVTTRLMTLTETDLGKLHLPGDRFVSGETVVALEISDTGMGIPDDVRDRLFDPFFTTKPVGSGTGLGLSICRKIIELHDGGIAIGNKPGGGALATVLIHIPKGGE